MALRPTITVPTVEDKRQDQFNRKVARVLNALIGLDKIVQTAEKTWTIVVSAISSITAGTGLTGGTITSTGTIALANTAVTPGTYTNANIIVDAQGRLTFAQNGTPGSGGTAVVTVKPADESVTSSTVLQDDDDLVLTVAANETWVIDYSLFVSGLGNIKVGVSVPALATGRIGQLGVISTAGATSGSLVADSGDLTTNHGSATAGAGTEQACLSRATVFNGANAGTVKLQWAQISSNATPAKVLKGSRLVAFKA